MYQGNLYVLGAGTSEKNWLQARQFPFFLHFPENLPETIETPGIALIRVDLGTSFGVIKNKHIPFLCYGDISDIERAFLIGAKDFIAFPFDIHELTARISRQLFLERTVLFQEYAISLQGNTLHGPQGTILLNDEEARILKMFALSEKHRIHRRVITEHFKPELQVKSRWIDMTIFRLRHKLALISDKNKPLQIKTIYGFGYQI